MAKEVVLNIKLDATEAIQKIKELAVNTGELKDRKKALNEAIKVEELMYKSLAALQAKGIDVGKDLASREEKLLRVRTQNREEIALIDTALKGNSAQTRELTNDVAGLTESGLRFRDKMAQAFSQAIGPTFAKLSDSVSHANLEMGKALKTFGAGSAEFLKAAGNAKKMEEAVDAVKQAQIEATAALKKFGENSDEFKKVNDNLRSLEDTAKQVGEEIGTKLEGGFTRLNVQIRAANKAAQEAAEKYGLASKEFKEAANRVDDLDDQLKRVNATVGSIDLDGKIETAGRSLQGLVGAFQVGESAAALMGVEAEDLNNTMLKVGAALALQDGIKGMIEGAKAAKALALSVGLVTPAAEGGTLAVNGLKLALVSSGIGAIVLLLGLFSGAFVAGFSSCEVFRQLHAELFQRPIVFFHDGLFADAEDESDFSEREDRSRERVAVDQVPPPIFSAPSGGSPCHHIIRAHSLIMSPSLDASASKSLSSRSPYPRRQAHDGKP